MTTREPGVQSRVSLDQLSSYGSAWVEVVNGEIVEIDMSAATHLHAIVIDNFCGALRPFVQANKLGLVYGDGLTYVLATGEKGIEKARIPNASFIRRGRLPKNHDLSGPIPIPPDLAVEVMSPDDRIKDLMDKITEYFGAGVDQVWAFFPDKQQIHQYRLADRSTVRIYQNDDVIDAEALFPGLKLVARDLFALPALD